MSEPLRNEYGDVLTCHYCDVGAAVVEEEVQPGERMIREQKGLVELESYRLCELCYRGSVRARGHIVYNTLPDAEIYAEKAAARMLNAMRGTVGS